VSSSCFSSRSLIELLRTELTSTATAVVILRFEHERESTGTVERDFLDVEDGEAGPDEGKEVSAANNRESVECQ
jgi:hypothetical protein